MADNGLDTPVIGVTFDGTGLGSDGHIWGGEFMVADYKSFNRVAHLEYLPLPGGDAAINRPYRIAISYLLTLLGENALNTVTAKAAKQSQSQFIKKLSKVETQIIKRQIERGLNSPLTSSMGRLFDAISALIGIRGEVDYEGQAAVELEMIAYKGNHTNSKESYPYHIVEDNGIRVMKLGDLLSAIVEDLGQNIPVEMISVRFHNTIAQMTNEMCQLIANKTGIKQVALSGGVFQNRLLLTKTVSLLENSGFQVLTHRQVPCNDGGISLGQAVIANFAQ
jgi:hydrogenase maturation protein HypF